MATAHIATPPAKGGTITEEERYHTKTANFDFHGYVNRGRGASWEEAKAVMGNDGSYQKGCKGEKDVARGILRKLLRLNLLFCDILQGHTSRKGWWP